MVVSAVYVVWNGIRSVDVTCKWGPFKETKAFVEGHGAGRVRTLMMMIRDACVQFTCPATGQTVEQTTNNCPMWDFIYSRPTHKTEAATMVQHGYRWCCWIVVLREDLINLFHF